MTDSQTLLAEYRQNGSDAAFGELIARFVDLVHSTALRLVEGDPHRAKDVTQTVFVDLARLARTLSPEIRLGGWLHRHTCFVAANTLRGERRRQARERQAVEMNTLQNHPEADLAQVAPLLDEAINELAEADRTAILLRFFEQQDFRTVGQALGSNEDAARMRVTRALEKLEEFLKRRGITTSAASLSVVLTANAVQAAPVGLALTISTAAALAGTPLTSSATATAVKTITMTTLQKSLITAAFVAAVGTGIYEARQGARLRDENQSLQQQQAQLGEQLEVLQRGHDAATSRLAVLLEENAGFRANPKQTEVLKLRGQVGALRQELASAAKTNSFANTLANLVSDPVQKELARVQIQQALKVRYAAFIQSQKLSPATAEKLVDLITETEVAKKERLAAVVRGETDVATALQDREGSQRELNAQLQALLGEAGAVQLGKQELAAGAFLLMMGINTQLGDLALNTEQSRQFLELVTGAPEAIVREDELDMFRTKEELDAIYQTRFDRSQQMMQQTGAFLSPEQAAALGVLNSNYWNGIRTQWSLGQQFIYSTFRR